jgi:hypothetical protein
VSGRSAFAVATVSIAFCLIAGSSPRVIGDGGEYLAQALNFAAFDGPSLGRQAIPQLEARIAELEPGLDNWSIERASAAGPDRRRDFVHFWFYALVAAPFVAAADLIGISPLHGFTVLNVLLLAVAMWLAGPRIGPPAVLLLFASPLVRWLDKSHTEVFTVALLTIALVAMRDKPWLAPVAAGAAATQNPPIAIVVAVVITVAIVTSRGQALHDRTYLGGSALGLGLAALQPAYTWLRHDTPSLLLLATKPGTPNLSELSASIIDPSMGLIGNYPVFLIACGLAAGLAVARVRHALARPDVVVAALAVPVFLYSFAQTSNPHHGGTPSITRYALWFIPLAVPLWRLAFEHRLVASPLMWSMSVLSAAVSLVAFHPAVAQNAHEPTWLASWIWQYHPRWHHPLAEVFAETHLRTEGTYVPVATPNCGKVLLSADPRGSWPLACLPAEIPAECRLPGALCYANRDGDRYTFSLAPGRPPVATFVPEAAWPADAEPHVRRLLLAAGWVELADHGLIAVTEMRERRDVRVSAFRDTSRLLLILQVTGPAPLLRLRMAAAYSGTLYAARTGNAVASVNLAAETEHRQDIILPADSDLYLLPLTRSGSS